MFSRFYQLKWMKIFFFNIFYSSEMFSVRRLNNSTERLVGIRLPEGLVVSVERKVR